MRKYECRKCGGSEFLISGGARRCRPCNTEWQRNYYSEQKTLPGAKEKFRLAALKTKYGLEPGDFERIVALQGGTCALCDSDATHVDHNHGTGKIRGVLCNACNTALGRLGDDPVGIRKALNYLEACIG